MRFVALKGDRYSVGVEVEDYGGMGLGITCGDPYTLPVANRKSAGYRHRFFDFTA